MSDAPKLSTGRIAGSDCKPITNSESGSKNSLDVNQVNVGESLSREMAIIDTLKCMRNELEEIKNYLKLIVS